MFSLPPITGEQRKQDQILLEKIGEYIYIYCVYSKFYLVWSPVIILTQIRGDVLRSRFNSSPLRFMPSFLLHEYFS